MKSGTITGLLGGVIVAGFSLGAFAEMKENPYQVIIDRNPFGLRPVPIPEPPKPPEAPAPPPLKITLTGVTTLLGPPRAILEFTDPQTQKTERPSPFEEGDTYKDIKIISIDAENKLVKIKVGDAETTLDFLKNGAKSSTATASAAPVPHPSMAPIPPVTAPAPAPVPAAAASPAGRSILGGAASPVSAVPTAGFNQAAVNPGGYTSAGSLPSRTVRTDTGVAILGGNNPPQVNVAQPGQTQPPMSREELIQRLQAQREAFQKQNPAAASIVPPIPGAPMPASPTR